jgi:hypothetical protein
VKKFLEFSEFFKKRLRVSFDVDKLGTGCLFLVAVKNELWFAKREFRQELRMVSPEFGFLHFFQIFSSGKGTALSRAKSPRLEQSRAPHAIRFELRAKKNKLDTDWWL